MVSFNVIWCDINKKVFEPYDVMPYFIDCYKELKKDRPNTFKEFKEFIKRNSMYMYWSRCQYEIILKDWPCGKIEEKQDVHKQIMMNIDIITNLLMKEFKK